MYNSSVVHPSSHQIIFKGDSGATNHYVTPAAASVLKNLRTNTSINVTLPDSNTICSTHSGIIDIPKLSTSATTAHVLPELSNTSLISLGQLADDGCLILLNNKFLKVFKNFELIFQGFRNKTDGLWDIPIPQSQPKFSHKTNVLTNTNQLTKTLVQYLHMTLKHLPPLKVILTNKNQIYKVLLNK